MRSVVTLRTRAALASVAVILVVVLVGALTACGGSKKSTGGSPAPSQSGQGTTTPAADQVTIVDQAGRTLTIPKQIHKIFSTSPMGAILVYTLNPDKVLAWNYVMSPAAKPFLAPATRNLPNLSGWYAANSANPEAIIKAHPDFIIDMSTEVPTDPATVSMDDKLQAQLNIPVVIVDGRLSKISGAYRFLGKITGDDAQAKALSDYVTQTLNDVKTKAATIPASKEVAVYYAEGPDGLQTEAARSPHAQLLQLIHARNVATIPFSMGQGGAGMSPVSMEQVLSWNPSLIVVGMSMGPSTKASAIDAYSLVKQGKHEWGAVSAVKSGQVYAMPSLPFSWFDRPPSVNQIIGLRWVANLVYPNVFKYDMKAETKKFFKLFYHVDVTDAEVDQILSRSARKS